MKLLRYGLSGQERPGLLDSEGRIRDLSRDVADIGPDCLASAGLAGLAKLDQCSLPLVDGTPRLGVPVARVGKFIAIGLNFVDHAAESNLPIPKKPVVFTKATSSLAGPNDRVMLPRDSAKSDWEVEMGVVIGRRHRLAAHRGGLSNGL
jgi:2,4-didehydro-3-deoxy-L-rhamnonate hydrolase